MASGGSDSSGVPLGVTYGLAILLAALVVGTLAWRWARGRRSRPAGAVIETRFIDRSRGNEPSRPAPGWLARLGLRLPPGDAVGAYLALVRDLETKPGVERRLAETPHEHAHRLRTSGSPTFALELLAADYGLARFGGRPLTPAENQRAVDRWRALRVRLSARSDELVRTAVAIEMEQAARSDRAGRSTAGAAQPGDAPPSDTSAHG